MRRPLCPIDSRAVPPSPHRRVGGLGVTVPWLPFHAPCVGLARSLAYLLRSPPFAVYQRCCLVGGRANERARSRSWWYSLSLSLLSLHLVHLSPNTRSLFFLLFHLSPRRQPPALQRFRKRIRGRNQILKLKLRGRRRREGRAKDCDRARRKEPRRRRRRQQRREHTS